MKNSTPAFLQRRQHRKARHTAQRQAQCRAQRRAAAAEPSRGQAVLYELCKTIHHVFPNLFDQLRQVEDCRQKSEYTLVEILLAGIMLFVFQEGSRNALNNKRDEKKFKQHYERLFKLRLPHLDTVHRVLCRLPDAELEQLKHTLVKTLLEKKMLHKYRRFERWFVVAVDGTGVVSFSEPHCEHCLHRTSKTGKTTYFHPVLEAKLITTSGLAISIATEWIANPDGEYDKQDGERKAFVRLAAQLKQHYPRLPICLLVPRFNRGMASIPIRVSSISAARMGGPLFSPSKTATCPPFGRTFKGCCPERRRSANTSGVTTVPPSSTRPVAGSTTSTMAATPWRGWSAWKSSPPRRRADRPKVGLST